MFSCRRWRSHFLFLNILLEIINIVVQLFDFLLQVLDVKCDDLPIYFIAFLFYILHLVV